MNLATQEWDEELCALVGIPLTLLPTIGASSCIHGIGSATSVIPGIPIACLIGDQSGAMLGQVCFHEVGRRVSRIDRRDRHREGEEGG